MDRHARFSRPARILLQDFTGVPAVVDLAAMRDGMTRLGSNPQKVNPLVPVDLVIDHSVIVDVNARADSLTKNVDIEFERNGDPATKVDLLLLGDGYTAAERRKFEADSRRLLAVLFNTSPFKERRRDFNVWGLVPAARESGISRPSTGIKDVLGNGVAVVRDGRLVDGVAPGRAVRAPVR